MLPQKPGKTADLQTGHLPDALARTPFCALAQTALPASDKPHTGLTTGLRRATSSPLERSLVHRPMSALPLSGSRGSRHHWAGPNADPIPENEPVRPSGTAQALLAPVRKASCRRGAWPHVLLKLTAPSRAWNLVLAGLLLWRHKPQISNKPYLVRVILKLADRGCWAR